MNHAPEATGREESTDFVSRRSFVRTMGAAALGSAVAQAADQPGQNASREKAAARFYKTLSPDQKQSICFPFEHARRLQVGCNWAIVRPRIADMTHEQQSLCLTVFKSLSSDDGFDRFARLMASDYGGFERYHVAVFGAPASGTPFEWVITGRHLTLRMDGNSLSGTTLGGPVFYGHSAQTGESVWSYQAEHARRTFRTLEPQQRAQASVAVAPKQDKSSTDHERPMLPEPGLAVASLDGQQRRMVRELLEMMFRPFRAGIQDFLDEAADEDQLRLAHYPNEADGGVVGECLRDGDWDIWKLQGPSFEWYFHGAPHVHAWLNVKRREGVATSRREEIA